MVRTGLGQKLERGTPMPGSIRAGPFTDGARSMSKIAVGRYTVEHEFGCRRRPGAGR